MQPWNIARLDSPVYGGDYNAEQWPEDIWREDVRLMRQAGVNLVSVGVKGAGGLKGFVCFGPTPLAERSYDIHWLAVDPEHQRSGVGGSLVEHVCRKAERAGARRILIETSSTNPYGCTRLVYGRLGFAEIARIPDYYRPGDDRVVYIRSLESDNGGMKNWR